MILSGLLTTAQNTYNVVVFSEDGEPFYAYMNGIRQNDKPETNIKVTGLNSEALNMRIKFENKALPILKQNMMPEFGYEYTIKIKRTAKKVMKMRFFGKVELAEAPRTNISTVQYHTAENALTPAAEQSESTFNTVNTQNNTTGTTIVTHSTVTMSTENLNPPINIDVNPNGINMSASGVNVNTHDINNDATVDTHTTAPVKGGTKTVGSTVTIKTNSVNNGTTYSTTSSTVSSSATSSTMAVQPSTPKPATVSAQPVANGGCGASMNPDSYENLKTKIDDTPFSDAKLSTAKLATKNACMTAEQVKGICSLLGMDDDKLAYAKFAYDYCYDKPNFYLVSEAFSFSTTTNKLNKYLLTK